MTHPLRTPVALAAALLLSPAWAVETTMTQGGFTGLEITPNAHLLGWGRFEFVYDNQLPGAATPSGHNFVTGFGLLPNLEISGRIAANDLHTSCFTGNCGLRDLSASFKAGIGLDTENRFRIAAGAADVGGQATNFRTYYGVLTYSPRDFEFSGGWAHRPAAAPGTARSPLDGPFASAAWQPWSVVRAQVEYTDHNAWAGVRLFAPQQWLPQGWSAHVGANTRLTDDKVTTRSWWTVGLSIPLYRVPAQSPSAGPVYVPPLAGTKQPLPVYESRAADALPPSPPAASVPGAPVAPALPAAATDEQLRALADELQRRGLEDIYVGRMPDGSVAVRANNATYNWNVVDALGAELGAVARTLGTTRSVYRVILTQRQLPLVAVTGQADCLRRWVQEANPTCTAGELTTPGEAPLDPLHAGASWLVAGLQPSWKTLRVGLSPVLRTNVATEVGVLDYSLGAAALLSLPLWSGATVDWRVQSELAASDDYRQGGFFYRRRVLGGTDLLAVTQTMRLPLERWFGTTDPMRVRSQGLGAVTAQATVGRVVHNFDGFYGALRWEPGEGRHRFTAQGGWLHNADFGAIPVQPRNAAPLLGTYRYNLSPTRTYLEATAGRFFNNDRGLQLGMRQWFGDVSVQAFARRTSFSNTPARNFVGLELSIPIGPRKDMNPSTFQVTGTPRFAHAVETRVGGGNNAVNTGYGTVPQLSVLDTLHNSDRTSLLYFEDNLRRLRDAAR